MAQEPGRRVWMIVLKNFIDSFKPRQLRGTLKGTDYMGNKYFEIPKSSNKQRNSRWFQPTEKDNFTQEVPAEWEAWLRGRRREPPTEEEVLKNLAVMKLKQKNAVAVEAKAGKKTPMQKGIETFPSYSEYESVPGRGPKDPK
ncbi:NADH dehydrogenase [ubiquinone] 1 alpha subcomplex assembly factor 2 [Coccinella septempunctata]|uniref:NADH dehydrogenase [ubiquinone] 1 alpha subcomplex assembly factor 2 n=1 Tax=Coccinella septempunctata TaxID=41139 RepID=UPI001D066952|nr:NADH dehydrogenase [ubiquinone] 1 alpha subcomplex assembly factor 2 [Coccinella septempunctata]